MPWISKIDPCPACQHSHTLSVRKDEQPGYADFVGFICPEKKFSVQLNALEWNRAGQRPNDAVDAFPATWGGPYKPDQGNTGLRPNPGGQSSLS